MRGDLPSIKEIVGKYSLYAKKALGQNFLFDANLTDKIVRESGGVEDKFVLEVGAGTGILTRSILFAGARKVIAIERDTRCIAALQDYLLPAFAGSLQLIEADALAVRYEDFYDVQKKEKIKIIANLPYNISVPLLMRFLRIIEIFEDFTLMFQKEVALRITASPRTEFYGRLSVMVQSLCDVELLFDVSPKAFVPVPKVSSSIVKIVPREIIPDKNFIDTLEIICRAAFNQRRKMLKSALRTICKDSELLLAESGISPFVRAEELTVKQFHNLTRKYMDIYTPPE